MHYREELEKTRNLESLGILAGGIAHDFNNILTSIRGNVSLLQEHCKDCAEKYPLLEQAEKAAERAKNLTLQLLTFVKGDAPVKQQASLKELIIDSTGFVIHGSSVRCEFELADNLWPCEVDTGQISQVIQNLVINAVRAMPAGGVVRISAKNINFTKDRVFGRTGRFVNILVRDEGTGIPEAYQEKVFVPFFTTKNTGNGLGLSICYSIISKHQGFITIDSKENRSTTVSFFLSAVKHARSKAGASEKKMKI